MTPWKWDARAAWSVERIICEGRPSGWANFYVHTLLSVRVRDLTAGFKIWRQDVLRDINLDRVVSDGYSFQVEMHYLATQRGHTIVEVPIRFEDRIAGTSKMTTRTKLESAVMPFQLRWRHRQLTGDRPASTAEPSRYSSTPKRVLASNQSVPPSR